MLLLSVREQIYKEVELCLTLNPQKKRVKVIATKTLRNKAINTALKTDIKKANIALENKDANTAEAVKVAIRAIDKATAKVFFIRILLPEKICACTKA